ncbi:MAG: transcriptional regulator [bacterium]|nr:transcriptional regulator [bacterium]
MRPPAASSARDKILFYLKTKGPQTAARLASRLGVTAMAVRQHLYQLAEDGLVDFEDRRKRVGRPARHWRLTNASDSQFPDSHAELALTVIQAARAAFGSEGIDRLVAQRTKQQLAQYREAIPVADPLDKKVAALTALRRQEGYMAEWSRESDGALLLVENNCPICVAARACQGLCGGELELFRKILGDRVTVERAEYILDGDRRCAYRIRSRDLP